MESVNETDLGGDGTEWNTKHRALKKTSSVCLKKNKKNKNYDIVRNSFCSTASWSPVSFRNTHFSFQYYYAARQLHVST